MRPGLEHLISRTGRVDLTDSLILVLLENPYNYNLRYTYTGETNMQSFKKSQMQCFPYPSKLKSAYSEQIHMEI